ncbi:MAG TPA: caspase family protein, partial [Longimicrobium sp.]|nr:caspase family protein [Longimicrobium sp.]
MAHTVYALLVAIDDYPPPVSRLRGCVNDAEAMAQYLEARVNAGGRSREEVLKIERLLDRDATRQAVIEAFRAHLGQAGPDDVALFCYSGHGSQEQAPEEFWHLEPDRLDETLVLYDSRSESSWDLADKELAGLIAEVAAGGAHVAVLLDCCHSGSGTRAPGLAETAVRRAETDRRQRPLDSFIVAPQDLPATPATRDLSARPSGWDMAGRHVLMAACRDDEEAKECLGGDAVRGAFSYFLGETLRTVGGGITYRDLFTRVAALVRTQVQRQSPQLEATVADDLRQPFLGGVIVPSPRYFVVSHAGGRWVMDAGRMHGIPEAGQDDPVVVALFDYQSPDEDLTRPDRAIGKAAVTEVLAASSVVRLVEGTPDPAAGPLKAVLLLLPSPRLRVRLEGDAGGLDLVRQPLSASLFVREAATDEGADYRLLATSGQYLIARPDDDRPLVEQLDGYTPDSASAAVARLEHIGRWKTTAELDNPATSIRPDELQ